MVLPIGGRRMTRMRAPIYIQELGLIFFIDATYHQEVLSLVKHHLPYERPGNMDFLIIVKLHLILPTNIGAPESPCEAVLI